MKSAVLFAALAAAGATSAQPMSFIDLGAIGNAGNYVFDTAGTVALQGGDIFADVDTEMAIWDASGLLLDQNDDPPGGAFGDPSEITIDLAEGVYYIAVSEFNSVFGDDFLNDVVTPPFEDGDIYAVDLRANGSLIGEADVGFDSATGFDNQTQFFRVEVVPAPGTAALLGLGGLAAARRRR